MFVNSYYKEAVSFIFFFRNYFLFLIKEGGHETKKQGDGVGRDLQGATNNNKQKIQRKEKELKYKNKQHNDWKAKFDNNINKIKRKKKQTVKIK